MTACTVSGNTFAHREILKAWGGSFDMRAKLWTFDTLSDDRIARLRKLVGVMVNERAAWAPPWARERGPTVIYGDDPTYLNHFADKNPPAFFGFGSFGAFLDYVEGLTEPPADKNRAAGWKLSDKEHEKRGTSSLPEAIAIARRGWSDGLGIIDKLEFPKAHHKQRLRSVAGGTVNVGRMLAGNPAHMTRRARLPGHRTVTLFVQASMWHGITLWNALLRGWLVMAMIDVLEQTGYRCELIAVRTVIDENGDTGAQHAIKLKDARDRLNLSDVSFALGHPSFNRRLCFATVGASEACSAEWRGMGALASAFDEFHTPGRNEFYIPGLLPHQQKSLDDTNPFDMLRFIQPDGLPVKLLER
jgi:hypothetical protein